MWLHKKKPINGKKWVTSGKVSVRFVTREALRIIRAVAAVAQLVEQLIRNQ